MTSLELTINGPRGPWLMAIEVKGPKTPWNLNQKKWAVNWMSCGLPYFVVRHPREIVIVYGDISFPHLAMVFRGEYKRESEVQGALKSVLKLHRWKHTDTSQGYRPGGDHHGSTRITLGAPDLVVYHPALPGG